MPRAYWDWDAMLRDNKAGFFPYTPSTNLLYGLREAIRMFRNRGSTTFRRGTSASDAPRARRSSVGTGNRGAESCRVQPGADGGDDARGRGADAFRQVVLDRFDMSLGTGLGKLKDKSSASGTWATSTT